MKSFTVQSKLFLCFLPSRFSQIRSKMVKYATKFGTEHPYSIPNPGPTPKIDQEEGLPQGALDIAWVEESRKNAYHWSKGLKWHDRLHAHATMNSARRNHKCHRPFAPKDELDFILDSIYDPLKDAFSEKQDIYLQMETAYGEDMNIGIRERAREQHVEYHPSMHPRKAIVDLRGSRCTNPQPAETETWRLLRNRIVIYPDKSLPRSHPIKFADPSGQRRENIYNVKLGIAADHSPQTNPGYSRTPSGAFYAI